LEWKLEHLAKKNSTKFSVAFSGMDPISTLSKENLQKFFLKNPIDFDANGIKFPVYSCYKCNRWLFLNLHILKKPTNVSNTNSNTESDSHNTTDTTINSPASNNPTTSNNPSEESFVLDRMTWMSYGQVSGFICCPKCKMPLGTYSLRADFTFFAINSIGVHLEEVELKTLLDTAGIASTTTPSDDGTATTGNLCVKVGD